MTTLQPTVAARIGKLVPRLASDQDGEVLATARAIQRVLAASGLSLHELASFLTEGPTERIVYRDRAPAADPKPRKARATKPKKAKPEASPPPRNDPNKDYSVSFEEVMRVAPALVATGYLNQREHGFITDIHADAIYYREGFAMSYKQARWWRRIIEDAGISEPA